MDDHEQMHLDMPDPTGIASVEDMVARLSSPESLKVIVDQLMTLIEGGGDSGNGTGPPGALGADCQVAGIAAAFRAAVADRSLTGDLEGEPPGSHNSPTPSDIETLSKGVIDALATLVGDGHDESITVILALASYGGPFQAPAMACLESLGLPVELAPEPKVTRAIRVTSVPGDEEGLVLELVYPGELDGLADLSDPDQQRPTVEPRVGVVVALQTFAGPLPVDAAPIDVGDALIDLGGPGGDHDHGDITAEFEEVPVAEAIALLDHSLWLFDHTLGAGGHLDDDSGLLAIRPILDRLVATHPHPDYTSPEVDGAARVEVGRAFSQWVATGHPEIDDDALDFVPLLVDFAADRGGDPRRWSPPVAIGFLEMACGKVMASPEELAVLPDLVRLMVRWSHGENGWPAAVTNATLEAVDHVESLFEAELEIFRSDTLGDIDLDDLAEMLVGGGDGMSPGLDRLELTVPPVGGSHPEPFDDRRIRGEIRQRVGLIVAEATYEAIELFDAEYATLTRRLIADVARRQKAPFGRGRPTIWASAAIYAVAQMNHIPGGWSPLARPAAEITEALDGAASTIVNKARELRDLVDGERFPPEPRYQHSTSSAAVGDVWASFAHLVTKLGSAAGSGPPPAPPSPRSRT